MPLSFSLPAEEDVLRRLSLDNPWWEDRNVPGIADMPERSFFPRLWGAMSAQSDKPVVLAGPRGVGKTVMVMQAIAKLLHDGVGPRHLCYVSFDRPLLAGLDLVHLPELLRGSFGVDGPLYLFLDEIAYLPGWEDQLSAMLDADPMLHVVALSPLAPAENASARLDVLFLPPFTFAEYLQQLGIDPKSALPETPEGNRFRQDLPEGLETLNRLFLDYVQGGGFYEEGGESGAIEHSLHSDLPGLHGIASVSDLHRLFLILAYNTGSEFSIETLATELGLAKNTLRRYLEYLESTWLVRRLHRVDQDAKPFQRAVAFKVHLTHPALRAGLIGRSNPGEAVMTRLAETALHTQFLASAGIDNLYYARWNSREVPFVYLDRKTGFPLFAYYCAWSDAPIRKPKAAKALINFKSSHMLPLGAWVITQSQWHSAKLNGESIRFEPASVLALRIGLEFSQPGSR